MAISELHPTPSVGSLIKKLHLAHPELGTKDLIDIIRGSMQTREASGDFAAVEVVNEERALALARARAQSRW